MSAPPDPALAKQLLTELAAQNYYDDFSNETAASVLYLVEAILDGSWCDFEQDTPSGEVLETLKALPCRPLLEPFLESSIWSENDIMALRVKEKLKS